MLFNIDICFRNAFLVFNNNLVIKRKHTYFLKFLFDFQLSKNIIFNLTVKEK